MPKSAAPNKTDFTNPYVLNINNIYRVISISSSNQEIKSLIEPFGYSENKLFEGIKLYESIRNIQNTLNVIQRWQRNAEKRLSEAKDAAFQTIQELQQTTRTAAGHPISPDISRVDMETLTVSAFLSRAYAVLRVTENISESNTELVQSNHADAKRKLERSKIIAFDNANQLVEAATTSVKKANAELNETTNAFRSWCTRYLTMVKTALRGNKRLLNKLGLDTKIGSCISDNDNNPL